MKVHFELAANFNKACFDWELKNVDELPLVEALQTIYDFIANIEIGENEKKASKTLTKKYPSSNEEMATEKQLAFLKGLGINVQGEITKKQAFRLIKENKID